MQTHHRVGSVQPCGLMVYSLAKMRLYLNERAKPFVDEPMGMYLFCYDTVTDQIEVCDDSTGETRQFDELCEAERRRVLRVFAEVAQDLPK